MALLWSMLAPALAWALHLLVLLALVPLALGLPRGVALRVSGQGAPAPWQPAREIARLLRKRPVLADGASVIGRVAPALAAGAALAAAALSPGFAPDAAPGGTGDLLLLAGLLALPRAAAVLAALDAGTAGPALAAGRLLSAEAVWPAAILPVAALLAALSGAAPDAAGGLVDTFREEGLAPPLASLALAAVAMAGLALSGAAAAPSCDAALVESSGRHLAMWRLAEGFTVLAWLSILAAALPPYASAEAARLASWPLGLGVWLLKLAAGAALLGLWRGLSPAGAPPGRLALPAAAMALLGLLLLALAAGVA